VEAWTHEAIRWGVCCSDLTLAYRALVILNALNGLLDRLGMDLLVQAAEYHLQSSGARCSDFIGEMFLLLSRETDTDDSLV
jgi:hypothetical protein